MEYGITGYGCTLHEPLAALARWSETNGQPLVQARQSARCGPQAD